MILSFDAKRYFHNNRGLGNYSRDVIRLLSSYYPENEYYLFNPKTARTEREIPAHTQVVYPQNFFYKKLPSLWRSSGCIKQIEALNTDIYHGLNQELPSGIHKTRVKTVVTMHDAIFVRYPELYDALYRKIFIKKNKYSVKAADRIIAISKQTKNDFIEFFDADASKIDVVYQGCNAIFRQKITDENKETIRKKYNLPSSFILDVGAIEKRKNLETVIKALHIAKIDMPLVVIGNKTDYLNEMYELIKNLKLEKQVIFMHGVPTEDLPIIYNMASLFVYPSIFEGFGIPILEALCTETPVITSKGSCFKETGGDAAIYVSYDNPEEMADAINRVLGNNDLQQEMIKKGLIQADKFTDEKVASSLYSVYKNLV